MKDEKILILCGFLDLFSVSILITSLPLHLKTFNLSTTYIGLFSSLYGAIQILSSYLMGYLADQTGKKFVICFCTIFTGIGYIALGLAPSFKWIFLLRIISALFKQSQTLSRTILATKFISDDNERIVVMGKFSTFSSVGFIFGPPIGGYIYQNYGFFYISLICSLGFLTMFILFLQLDVDFMQNKSNYSSVSSTDDNGVIKNQTEVDVRKRKETPIPTEEKSNSPSDATEYSAFFIFKRTWEIQLSIFLLSFCPLLFRTNYSLALKELFQSTSVLSGFATSYGSVTGSIAGLVVPFILRYYQTKYDVTHNSKLHVKNRAITYNAESKLLLHTSLVLAFSFLGCSLATNLTLFILCQFPISFMNGLSREGFNMMISKRVSKKEVGRVMGMTGSLVAFGRLLTPVTGGLLQEISYRLPVFCSSVGSFVAAGIIYQFLSV